MKKFVVALCLIAFAFPIFIASTTPISAAYYESQEVVASPFNILPDKPVKK